VNKRVQFIARRALGADVERAATGVARPVPFGGVVFALALLGLLFIGADSRSWWALAGIGALIAFALVVVAMGRNVRVLVGIRGGRVEVYRLRLGIFTSGPIAMCTERELETADAPRAFLLYLAPGGMTEIDGLEIALNQPLD
jgi:hypothetical protein